MIVGAPQLVGGFQFPQKQADTPVFIEFEEFFLPGAPVSASGSRRDWQLKT
jgi:hypothetical protein